MIRTIHSLVKTAFFVVLFSVFSFTGMANAATCKGMPKSQCSTQSSCSWVDSYKRSDGVAVNGYCGSKGGQSAKTLKKPKEESSKAQSKTDKAAGTQSKSTTSKSEKSKT